MTRPVLVTAVAALFFLSGASGAPRSAEPLGRAPLDLEPAINGRVSPSGRFPTPAMEEEFATYLEWVDAQGLSPLVAFESLLQERPVELASPRMQEQFEAYMEWVAEHGLSPFYAFTAGMRD